MNPIAAQLNAQSSEVLDNLVAIHGKELAMAFYTTTQQDRAITGIALMLRSLGINPAEAGFKNLLIALHTNCMDAFYVTMRSLNITEPKRSEILKLLDGMFERQRTAMTGAATAHKG